MSHAAPVVVEHAVESRAPGPAPVQAPPGLRREPRPPDAHEAAAVAARRAQPAQNAPAAPAQCVPARALTWADFGGAAPRRGRAGARTVVRVVEVRAAGATVFQARFDRRRSWVRARYSSPANRALTSCRSGVLACERYFDRLGAGRAGEWSFDGNPDRRCPAAVVPSAEPTATSRSECDSVIGAECDRAAALESRRLLRHEQLHFDIACQIASKANAALAAGAALATVRAAVRAKLRRTQRRYDANTRHGCVAAHQAAWEREVAGGLRTVTIP